jgi:hypothetical protein
LYGSKIEIFLSINPLGKTLKTIINNQIRNKQKEKHDVAGENVYNGYS